MKRTNKSACGTSFHGTTITSTVNILKEVLGEPQNYSSGDDKTTHQWTMLNDFEDLFTVYDWKEYRKFGDDEYVEFHIGGKRLGSTEQAKKEILAELLNRAYTRNNF